MSKHFPQRSIACMRTDVVTWITFLSSAGLPYIADIPLLIAPSGLECVLECQGKFSLHYLLLSMNRFLNSISHSNQRTKPVTIQNLNAPRPRTGISIRREETKRRDGIQNTEVRKTLKLNKIQDKIEDIMAMLKGWILEGYQDKD